MSHLCHIFLTLITVPFVSGWAGLFGQIGSGGNVSSTFYAVKDGCRLTLRAVNISKCKEGKVSLLISWANP